MKGTRTLHQPVETAEGDAEGTVRLCLCCRRPWVLTRIRSPFGPVDRFFKGETVQKWVPEPLGARMARRWWQFKAWFKTDPGRDPLWVQELPASMRRRLTVEGTDAPVDRAMVDKVWEGMDEPGSR